MKSTILAALFILTAVTAQAVNLTTTYSENFDSMGTAGVTAPAGWTFHAIPGDSGDWTTSVIATGAGGGTANATFIASTTTTVKSSSAGYNFALAAATADRALATSPTEIKGATLQLTVTNTSGGPLNGVYVGYDTRRFSLSGGNNELPGFWLFYSLDNGSTWTNFPAFNPTITTVPNSVGVTTTAPALVTFSSALANNSAVLFRWVDDNAQTHSPDQILGLDNLSIAVPIGQAPVVTLTAPANGSVWYLGDAINLAATASDPDGSVTKVEFYQAGVKLGEDASAPYAFTASGLAAGNYSLTARATDNDSNVVTSAAGAITVTTGLSGTLTRSPYLNSASHNSIVVRWRSSQAIVGRVRYGTSPDALNQFTAESVARTDHEVRLTGLTPYTRYYYSVGSALDTLTPEAVETTNFSPGAPAPTAADYTFRTSPVSGTAVNARIWIVGDCGRGTQIQASGRDAYYTPGFNGGYTGNRIPDLNLQMGDNAYNSGTDSEYQTGYFNMYANIFRKMPQWSCLGNHDANNGSTSTVANFPYFDMFTFPTAGECGGAASGTERYYSFDYGNIHFICLDSQASVTTVDNPATTGVNEDGPMAIWLRLDLASTTATWIIAFWHHPPYSKGSHNSDTSGQLVTMRTNFNPILENGGVDLVFLGHSHNYERSVLLDGHYGTSDTITNAMKKNRGNGSTTGFTTSANGKIRNAANRFIATATTAGTVIPPDGAYIKPLTGPRDHFGAVYNTAGMSGLTGTEAIDHSAMYISYNNVGTVNLDVNSNSLTCTFVQSGGATPDNFTITKQGAADSDGDGMSDAYEIANGLSRYSNDAAASSDSDELSNFLEFAFGLNPNVNDGGFLEANVFGGILTKRGKPAPWYQTSINGTDFRVIYIRRKDAAEAGLVYIPQFSGNLVNWSDSAATPTVIADDGEVEAVSVEYPLFPAAPDAGFFRLGVRSTH